MTQVPPLLFASSCPTQAEVTAAAETTVSAPSSRQSQPLVCSVDPQPRDQSHGLRETFCPATAQVQQPDSQDCDVTTIVSPETFTESSYPGKGPVLGPSPQFVSEGVGRGTVQSQPGSLFLELFAGTARMSKAFSRVGFQVLAVDSVKPQGVPALALDLTKASSRNLVLDLVQSKRLAAVHLAPPCGTSSRAREIYAGPGCPQPLRSPLHADGLPGLSFLQRTRVSAANKLYRFTAEVIRACHSLGVLWSLENPQSSMFWLTSPIQQLWQELRGSVFFATFDSCVYGGLRKKATTFWSSAPVVQSLSLRCHDGLGHQHLPWGRQGPSWTTAEEAAYPQALCRHWASIVLEDLSKAGLVETQGSQPGTAVFAAAERAALGLFPKAMHAPVCVDPFQGQQWVKLAGDADRTKFVPGVRLHDSAFPKGSTTIKVSVHQGCLVGTCRTAG